MIRTTRSLAAAALSLGALLAACSDGGTTAGTTGSGGDGSGGAGGGSGGGPAVETPITWTALPIEGAPTGRYLHTAVWTGKAMIVWGGRGAEKPQVVASGGIYDPEARTWKPTSTAGAPSPRYLHSAVWTGSKMLVWGGYGDTALAADGAAYDPASDTWTPIASASQPPPRTAHSALWTGTSMLIWGGLAGMKPLGSGGAYDPASNTWTTIPTASAPSPRFSLAAAWTGKQMIAWGGSNFTDWQANGGVFDPGAASWVGATSAKDAPTAREGATGVWTGSDFLVWGGWTGGPYENTGGLLSGAGAGQGGVWTATSTKGAPEARYDHVGLWTGKALLIWGGCGHDTCASVFGDGGRLYPASDGGRWSSIATQAALSPRRGATGVVAGSSILVWGGLDPSKKPLATGAESAL